MQKKTSTQGDTGMKNASPSTSGDVTIRIPVVVAKLPQTGAALDRLLSIPVNAWADRLKTKYDENAASHLKAINEARNEEGRSTVVDLEQFDVSTMKAFEAAVTYSGEIDEKSDPELAAAWRAALDDCLGRNPEALEIIEILKSTPRRSIQTFLKRSGKGLNPLLRHGLDRKAKIDLVSAGLLSKSSFFSGISTFATSIYVALIAAIFYKNEIIAAMQGNLRDIVRDMKGAEYFGKLSFIPADPASFIFILLCLSSGIVGLMLILYVLESVHLTNLGRRFLTQYRYFWARINLAPTGVKIAGTNGGDVEDEARTTN
jgi:hypothetical protein